MIDKLEIRESRPNDIVLIEKLYPEAFPDEDLLPVVRALLKEAPTVVSLVGIADKVLAGHVMFTPCSLSRRDDKVALLAPLAVAASWQRRGVGGAIVNAGLQRLENDGVALAFVLGDPAYYGRFGFAPDDNIAPPYPLPEEWRGAWQSLSLRSDTPPLSGKLSVPQPWRRQALWAP